MKITRLGFITLIPVLLTCCDYGYDYTYKVTNDSDFDVKIELETFRFDSTYFILAHERKTLFTKSHGAEGSKGPYYDDVANDLYKFVLTKNDTIFSTRDYLENAAWEYNDGLYHATIESEEFE